MNPLHTLRDGIEDESLRAAMLIGLLTVPFTVAFSWGTVADDVVVLGGSISGWALVLVGVAVGYVYHGRPVEVKRAGIWAGLAGSLGTVIVFSANAVTTAASVSWPWSAAVAIAAPIIVGFGVALSVLTVAVPAIVTDWVLKRLELSRRTRTSERTGGENHTHGTSRWWPVLAIYAILTPVALGYSLGVRPDDGVGLLLDVLAMISVVLLSILTLVALFLDATAPRDAQALWVPNVWAYVATPIATSGLVYLFAVVRGWGFPQGYGQYAFIVALWVAAVVYLGNWRRHGASNRHAGAT